jgi:hypothetical protein
MHPAEPTLHEGFLKDARDDVRLAEAVNDPIAAPVAADYPWGGKLILDGCDDLINDYEGIPPPQGLRGDGCSDFD